MDSGMQLFLSNRLEVLFDHFKTWLMDGDANPFTTRIVIVPHAAMKSWLQLRLATSIGICAGLQIQTIDPAIRKIATLFPPQSTGCVPSRLELSIALHQLLQERMKANDPSLLQIIPGGQPRRILALAEELAALFESYGRHGARLVEQWKQAPSLLGWQEQLWVDLYQRWPEWQPLFQSLDAISCSEAPKLTVVLFGVPYVSPVHYRFLTRLAKTVSVTYLLPSACQHYWSDVVSPREERRLKKMLIRQGVSNAKQEALTDLLQDTNPLLASLGKLGRAMALQLDESDLDFESAYVLPETAACKAPFAELVTPETVITEEQSPLTLLEAVKADLTLLRTPSQHTPLDFVADHSVQVHVSHSRIREVEALYNTLLTLIAKHSNDENPICPSDILVMAPDIDAYRILIDAVFGASHSQLPYRIVGASWSEQSSFVEAAMTLLELASGRWDIASLLQIWGNPHLRQKHQLTGVELESIRSAIEKVGITWGKDLTHRNAILRRAHCRQGMQKDGAIGTWEHGIGLLLDALANGDSKIDFADAEILGKWLSLFRSLWSDLLPFADGSTATLSQWALYLKCLFEAYLAPADRPAEEDRDRLWGLLNQLKSLCTHFPDAPFDAATVLHYLRTEIKGVKGSSHEGRLQTVRLGDVTALSGEPARVIAFLGMEDGAFPRGRQARALDLLSQSPLADRVPADVDVDRYAFLQAIQASRGYLILSYRGLCPSDGKEQGPALVVSELLSYLNRYYTIEGKFAGKAITTHHPYYPFDDSYFKEETSLQGYREDHYRAALARSKDTLPHFTGFLPELFASSLDQQERKRTEKECIVDVKELRMAAKDPLRLYLNHKLGFYIRDFDDTLFQTEETFVPSPLDRYAIHDQSLEMPIQKALTAAREQGRLPIGLFGDVAMRRLQEDGQSFQTVLRNAGTSVDELFNIELSCDCVSARQVAERHWHFPPLQLTLSDGTPVKIVGKISNLSPAGLAYLGDKKPKHRVRAWPLMLLLQSLQPLLKSQMGLDIPAKVIFLKEPNYTMSSSDSSQLESFIDYTLLAMDRPSPLVDELVKSFVDQAVEALPKELLKEIQKDTFHHHYVKWLMGDGRSVLDSANLEQWQLKARELYGSLMRKS